MIDFSDPRFLQDPYPTLNEVREATPIFHGAENGPGGEGIWFLTRYDDVAKAQRDRRLGRVTEPVLTREEAGLPPLREDWGPYYAVEQWSLLMLEGADHNRMRRLISREFTPRRIQGLRPKISAHADRFLEAARAKGEFDLLEDYAQPYSVHVIAELLGAPTEDWRLMLDWSHRIVKMYELGTSEEQAADAVAASAEFDAWCRELIALRRAEPGDDLITGLCTVETEDGRLSVEEIVSTMVLLLNAGHEATVNTLGNGVTALLQNPDQWRRVVGGEVEPAIAVEEMIRYDPPLQLFERWVLADGFEIAGKDIPKGQKIGMLFGSANRDPRHFDAPDVFDIGRGDNSHITFGGGIHFCIGAPLARLEVEVALERLLAWCPDLELTAAPRRHPAFVIHGYESVEVGTDQSATPE